MALLMLKIVNCSQLQYFRSFIYVSVHSFFFFFSNLVTCISFLFNLMEEVAIHIMGSQKCLKISKLQIKILLFIEWDNLPNFFHYNKSWFIWLGISIEKTPEMIFLPLVQLDQNAILDKSFWTRPFWLGFFGWFFY
jgi:hypothetical protein